ncbi:hypothetical protein [Owenweeksia hongkongensis]|uniref:hypothetical protein n=1 Tax=Owenweeksia hongkongensis TaxID=253245 RepID=UPI003A902E12
MFVRILFLALIFTQCTTSTKTTTNQPAEDSASYMRYIPGAGGGKGIIFTVPLKNPSKTLLINRFLINGIEVPAKIENNLIIASVFYANREPTVENPNPEPMDPVLFNENTFEAVIYYSNDGVNDSLRVTNFTEEKQPLYP